MKHLRSVRPLCWLLLGLFGTIVVCWNIWSWQYVTASVELHVLFTLFMIIHVGIYWIGVSVRIRKIFSWLFFCIQTGLILLLTQLTHLVIVTLVLSLVLLVVATLTLERVSSLLIALGSYLLLLLLYMNTFGPDQEWQAIWSGGYAPEVAILGLFFLVVLMLYLHQELHSHERTKDLLHQLDIAHAQLSTYALRVEELTMITERQRIARDLHDTLVQGVAGLIMQLNVVQAHLQHQRGERAQEILEQVMEEARNTLADARCAIGELRTVSIRSENLVEVVQEEIDRFRATTQIPCIAKITLLSRTPGPFCEHVLRAITEGLTNVARHAHAHEVHVCATQHDDMLTIEVRDDGIGFNPVITEMQVGRYGLLGMRERAKLIGGHLEIQSAGGTGTTLRLHIPVYVVQKQKGENACLSPFGSLSPTII